jgi:preprotein translocase subunit SecF
MFFRRLNWNVVGWFRTVSLISYAVIFLGVVALGWHATHAPGGGFQPSHALRLGLSFTGGTDVTVKFRKPQSVADITKALESIGVTDARVNTLAKATDAEPNERYTIETQVDFGDDAPKLWTALGTLGAVDRSQSQIETVGPSLGREYLIKAGEALVIAIAIQFVYIAFRFGWNYIFGLVVVIALVRDAAMMIGIYAIADRRADDAFLAAILTVIGYSVMDTIVILDRIRENVKVMAGKPYQEIVNTSILQTMTRSVNTLATVVVTLVALIGFGGASLQNFAFALLVGICSGGYHSIFYSAPLVHVLRERQLASASARRDQARAMGEARPRTVAEARAQASASQSRDDVLAARKERRKKSTSRSGASGPAKYKRKRTPTNGGGTATAATAAGVLEDVDADEDVTYDERELTHDHEFAPEHDELIDPLDAQNAGLHESELALGHEEIHLNLDDEPEAHPPGDAAAVKHD